MEEKIHTNVDVKHFHEHLKLDKCLVPNNSNPIYVHQATHAGTRLILRGHAICLRSLRKEDGNDAGNSKGSSQAGEVFEEYFLAKALASYSPHVAKPLRLDYAIENERMYVEIIYECGGSPLNELRPMTVEKVYNLMRQSANALLLFRRLGIVEVDAECMTYDGWKDVLQFVGLGKILNWGIASDITKDNIMNNNINGLDNIPNELLELAGWRDKKPDLRSVFENVDTYCWALSFYLLLTDKNVDDLKKEYQFNSEASYYDFMQSVKLNLGSVAVSNSVEEEMRELMQELLYGALKYEPRERPTLGKIVRRMKKFERAKNVAIKYLETGLMNNKHLVDLLTPTKRPHKGLNVKGKTTAKLSCGHEVTKGYLIKYVLKLFMQRQPYGYNCFCPTCGKVQGVRSIPLDCGCSWTKFKGKLAFSFLSKLAPSSYDKCNEGEYFSYCDMCLVNDDATVHQFLMMFDEFEEGKKSFELMETFNKDLNKQKLEEIVWILSHTGLIVDLNLYDHKIEVSDAKVIGEALKSNKSLRKLNLNYNNLGDEGANVIGEALKTNTTLRWLHLGGRGRYIIDYTNIGNEGAKAIGEGLKRNKALTHLDVGNNYIEDEGAVVIAEALKTNTTLLQLNIEDNKIGNEGMRCFGEALEENKTLKDLNLHYNDIGQKSAVAIAKALTRNTTIARLNLNYTKLGDVGTKVIAKAMKRNEGVEYLNLDNNNMGPDVAKVIGTVLRHNKILSQLWLRNNEIGDEGAIVICKALRNNKTLTQLSLEENKIEERGGAAIGEALKHNKMLARLYLEENKIGDEGGKFIGEALRYNKSLQILNMNTNDIANEGGRAIGESLRYNKALTELYLQDNEIGYEGAKHIGESLKENKVLVVLNLNSNKIGDEDTKIIANSLKSNKVLSLIHLESNKIGDEGARGLGEALKLNNTLTRLHLYSNYVGDEGAMFLSEALEVNTTLKELDLGDNELEDEGWEALKQAAKENPKINISLYT